MRAAVAVTMLLALFVAIGLGCAETHREQACRLAVKRLAAAPDRLEASELRNVVSYGAYALPDIEQELHVAPVQGRLRLVEALRRIGSPQALPLLDFLSLRDGDDAVRSQAARSATMLRRAAGDAAPPHTR